MRLQLQRVAEPLNHLSREVMNYLPNTDRVGVDKGNGPGARKKRETLEKV